MDEGFRRRVGLEEVDSSSEADECAEAEAFSLFTLVLGVSNCNDGVCCPDIVDLLRLGRYCILVQVDQRSSQLLTRMSA
jgi:hypothetical protein